MTVTKFLIIAAVFYVARRIVPWRACYLKLIAKLPKSLRCYLEYFDKRQTAEFCRCVENALVQEIQLRRDPSLRMVQRCPTLSIEAGMHALRIDRCRHKPYGVNTRNPSDALQQLLLDELDESVLPICLHTVDRTLSTEQDVARQFYELIDTAVLRDPQWISIGIAIIPSSICMQAILFFGQGPQESPPMLTTWFDSDLSHQESEQSDA